MEHNKIINKTEGVHVGFLTQYYYFTLLFKGMKDLIAFNYSFYFFKSIQD